jgi:hypothetical protein
MFYKPLDTVLQAARCYSHSSTKIRNKIIGPLSCSSSDTAWWERLESPCRLPDYPKVTIDA